MNTQQISIVINLIELLALLYVFVSVRMLQKNKRFYLKSWKKLRKKTWNLRKRLRA